MNPSSLKPEKVQLMNQLVYFDEEKSAFLDHYFPQHGRERQRAAQFLSDYTAALEKSVSTFDKGGLHSVVLIGSRVQTKDMEDQAKETFFIVFPNQADPDQNLISFLSPIGFQLLLAAPGEVRTIEVPTGSFTVLIEEVDYANLGEPDEMG